MYRATLAIRQGPLNPVKLWADALVLPPDYRPKWYLHVREETWVHAHPFEE